MNYKIEKNPVFFDNNIISYCGKFMGNITKNDLQKQWVYGVILEMK